MPVTISAISAGVKGAAGIAQYLKGRKLAKNNARPKYEIPDEIKQNLNQAQLQALEGLPEEQKNQYLQNIGRSENFGLNAINDRKGGLSGLEGIVQNSNDAYNNLMSADSVAKRQNQMQLMQQRGVMAGYKDQQFDINKVQPFQQQATAAQGLQGAGLQNFMGALDSFGSIAGASTLSDDGTNQPTPYSKTGNTGQGSNIPPYQMGGLRRYFNPYGNADGSNLDNYYDDNNSGTTA